MVRIMAKVGRPKGESKTKSSIRISEKFQRAIGILLAFRPYRSRSDCIEKVVIQEAKKVLEEKKILQCFPELNYKE